MQELRSAIEIRRLLFSRRAHLLTTRLHRTVVSPLGAHDVRGTSVLRRPEWNGERALCEALAAPVGALWTMLHFCESVIIVHAVGRRTANAMLGDNVSDASHLPANCLQKTATGSFVAVMGIVANPHLLFQKKQQKPKVKGR